MSRGIKLSVLSSGSKGNSLYIEGPKSALLVDVGLSAREIARRIREVGGRPEQVGAILVTHEHVDHLRGVRVLAERLRAPVLATAGTLSAAALPGRVVTREIHPGRSFEAGDFTVLPFATPHDAADPVGFLVEAEGVRIGVATDLGCGTALVRQRLLGCRALVLEFNHDERMLMEGPYPWVLKQRVRSRTGHLSNGESSEILSRLASDELQCVFLAHMSEVNNRPELAAGAARDALAENRSGAELALTSPYRPLPMAFLEI